MNLGHNKVILFLRSSLFMFGMVIATIIHAILSMFTFPFSFKVRYHFITLWSRFIIWWLKITCGIHYTVSGLENIPDTTAIILSNHQSAWETLALQLILPPHVTVLKKELLRVPFFGWALALLDPIAIDRNQKASALEQLISQGKETP